MWDNMHRGKEKADMRGENVMLMREKIAENRISAFTTGMRKENKDKNFGSIRRNKITGRYYAIGYENVQRVAR